jgi:NitT/TauT family transport system permease protein
MSESTATAAKRSDSPVPSIGLRGLLARRQRLILGLVGLATFLGTWELLARIDVLDPTLFSSPSDVVAASQSEVFRARILRDLWTSLSELIVGVSVAGIVGFVIGFAVGWFKHVNYVFDPWITVLYSTPKVALVPLIILMLGIDFEAKAAIVALMSVISVIVNTMVGVQAARGPLLDVSRAFGASQLMQWRTVVLPASIPFVVTGIRLALSHGMVGVIVAELVAGTHGLGSLLRYAAFSLQTGIVFLAIILIGLWGMLAGEVMRRVEARVERWRPA